MNKEEIRNCLSTLYDAQALRIATSNRLFQIFSKETENNDTDIDSYKLNKSILEEYEKITDYKTYKKRSIKATLKDLKDELELIDTEEKFEQVKAYSFLLESEKTYNKLFIGVPVQGRYTSHEPQLHYRNTKITWPI